MKLLKQIINNKKCLKNWKTKAFLEFQSFGFFKEREGILDLACILQLNSVCNFASGRGLIHFFLPIPSHPIQIIQFNPLFLVSAIVVYIVYICVPFFFASSFPLYYIFLLCPLFLSVSCATIRFCI